MMNKNMISARLLCVLGCIMMLSSCVNSPDEYQRQYVVNPDRMRLVTEADAAEQSIESNEDAGPETGTMQRLSNLTANQLQLQADDDIAKQFSDKDQKQVSARVLPVNEFLQVIFGELLNVNYIIADNTKMVGSITLNISEPVSSRRLFLLSAQLLDEKKLQITRREDVFYIHPKDPKSKLNVVIGLGRRVQDVPDTINPILQVVPLRYGIKTSLERNLRSLSSSKISSDFEQNALFVEGSRAEVIRTLDLISLLDIPSTRGRYIGLLKLTYLSPEEFTTKLTELMQAEGISASTRAAEGGALLMIPIDTIGAVALFANDDFILQRAEYWAQQIDQPGTNADKRYYVYYPRYARAADLGESVGPLIGSSFQGSAPDRTRDTQSAQAAPRQSMTTAASEDIQMIVDERSNTLVFYTRGATYQSLLPVVQRLDVLPKQVLLDATIAEVTMTEEFAQGFEFAFRSGKLTGGTLSALGVGNIGGFALNWTDGVSDFIARLSASNNLINILSKPTLVVRDGVTASITVGNDIPTVGSTTTNPNFESQTTNIVYRKTGVTLTVTPTINAQGAVILEIDQTISNQSANGPQIQGTPSIFERSIKTEVLAQDGQTILLGGLISENYSDGDSEVPGLASLPLFGNLFKSLSRKKEKTELVIFITPRVIEGPGQWQDIRTKLAEGLTSITLSE